MHKLKKTRKKEIVQAPAKEAVWRRTGRSHCVTERGHHGKPRVKSVRNHSMATHKHESPIIIRKRIGKLLEVKCFNQTRAKRNQMAL